MMIVKNPKVHVAIFCGFMAFTNVCALTGLRKQSDFLPGRPQAVVIFFLFVFVYILFIYLFSCKINTSRYTSSSCHFLSVIFLIYLLSFYEKKNVLIKKSSANTT